jgi:ATP-binding cassette subfamily B protein
MFNKIKNNPIIYLARKMWEFGRNRRIEIVCSMVASALAMMAWLTIPLVMARFINRAQEAVGHDAIWECAWFLALSVLIGIVAWIFHGPARVLELINSVHIRKNLHVSLLTKVTRLPIKWHTEHHSGDTIDRVAKAGSALSEFADASFMIVQLSARLVGAVVMMAFFMPEAAIIVTLAMCVSVALIVFLNRVLVPLYENGNNILNQVASKLQDYLTNITTLISLRVEKQVVLEVS